MTQMVSHMTYIWEILVPSVGSDLDASQHFHGIQVVILRNIIP